MPLAAIGATHPSPKNAPSSQQRSSARLIFPQPARCCWLCHGDHSNEVPIMSDATKKHQRTVRHCCGSDHCWRGFQSRDWLRVLREVKSTRESFRSRLPGSQRACIRLGSRRSTPVLLGAMRIGSEGQFQFWHERRELDRPLVSPVHRFRHRPRIAHPLTFRLRGSTAVLAISCSDFLPRE